MNTFEDLIQLSNECCDFEELTTSITEENALKEGKVRFIKEQFEITDSHVEIMVHDLIYPITGQMLDQRSGCISQFGKDLIESTEQISPDIKLITTYFSQYEKVPEQFGDILSEKLDPFTFFKFTQELFESFSTIPPDMKDEQAAMSDIIRHVLLNSQQLALTENLNQLNIEIVKIARETKGSNLELFKPIFQDCFRRAVLHEKVKNETLRNILPIILDSTIIDNDLITEFTWKYKKYNTPIHLISSLEQFQPTIDNEWLYPSSANAEMINDVKAKTTILIEKSGTLVAGKVTTGCLVVNISVDWEKKFKDKRMAKSAWVEIKYCKINQIVELYEKDQEIILPVFSKEFDATVTLYYIKDKYKKLSRNKVPKDGIGILTQLEFVPSTKDKTEKEEFKRRSSSFSPKCGCLKVKTTFYESDKIIPLKSPYNYKEPEIEKYLNFLITTLVNEWVNSKSEMSLSPPQELYLALVEYAVRYSIPATTIYILIAKQLLTMWCHAECYLNTFTSVFLCAFISMKTCKYTDKEEKIYKNIVGFLERNIRVYMIQHLSKPALYEKHALLPLFMLLSFIIPKDTIEEYVDHLVEKSHDNIIESATGGLKPLKSTTAIPEADALLKYCIDPDRKSSTNLLKSTHSLQTQKSNDESTSEKSNDESNSDSEKKSSKLPGKGSVTFNMNSIANTCETLVKRSKQLQKFYEDSSLPNFINQWESIRSELREFAYKLLKMFLVLNHSDCSDSSTFKFIYAYREMFTFYEIEEEYSPYVILLPIILDWIGRVGEKMVDWTNNAIKFDKFEIEDKTQRTSSSLKDLIEVFRQSFEFISSLKWDHPSIEEFVMTFLNLCGACLRNYFETLTLKILSFFPESILHEFNNETINHFIPDLKFVNYESGQQVVTPKSIFIMINNFVFLRSSWSDFAKYVQDKFQSIDIPKQLFNPVPNIGDVSQSIPNLFSWLTSYMVTQTVMPHLWVKNSKMKKMLVKKASTMVLNKAFFQSCSPIYAKTFDLIFRYIQDRIEEINTSVCATYYMTLIKCFLFGLDSGMMNLLIIHTDDPIKHKRLIPIMNFMRDLYNEVFQYILNIDSPEKIDLDMLKSYVPYSSFMFKNIHVNPVDLIKNDPKFDDIMVSLSTYIIVSSHTDNKKVKDWVHTNKTRFIGRRYIPPEFKK
ncbi:hypothetical protein TRFO_28760 [Tritrichomonas foetus]|uniref:MHD1 domain-containing protein n=1 Tax=Tritrichomonas foetus TaxID=1144522 RepID=A0A1J4JXN5_9EUKA|nr:hypothetical protein TRFO_28760 [Tritrichomonas foetus]|eukprot:OHT03913.1 hypothetical protein TRFO_28760 [Tritrichomonas foetus]